MTSLPSTTRSDDHSNAERICCLKNSSCLSFAQSVSQGGVPRIVTEWYDADNFGNASVTVEVDGATLHVVNDRGMSTIEVVFKIVEPIGMPAHPALRGIVDARTETVCPLETLAAVLGWIETEELIAHYGLEGYGQYHDYSRHSEGPPGPYLTFDKALPILRENWDEFAAEIARPEVQLRAGKLEERLQKLFAEKLGAFDEGTRKLDDFI